MTEQEQRAINWLSFAMCLPIAYRDEAYYYNKQANLFGAFGNNDYLLLTDDFSTKYITQYTDTEITLLKSVCIHYVNNQEDFVIVPRLSNEERVHIQMEFMATQHDHPDFKMMIDLIELQNDNTTFILLALFNEEPPLSNLLESWSGHMLTAMHQYITDFTELSKIDLTSVYVWDIEFSRKGIVERPNQTQSTGVSVKKPFWKIW